MVLFSFAIIISFSSPLKKAPRGAILNIGFRMFCTCLLRASYYRRRGRRRKRPIWNRRKAIQGSPVNMLPFWDRQKLRDLPFMTFALEGRGRGSWQSGWCKGAQKGRLREMQTRERGCQIIRKLCGRRKWEVYAMLYYPVLMKVH